MAKKIKIFSSCEGYNLAASTYDEKESYLNSFEKGKVFKIINHAAGKKIMDVGAGTGRITCDLVRAGANVVALDASEKMLAQLKKKCSKAEVVIGDAESIPFADNTFDWVVATFLIVHLNDPTKFFDEAYRVLKDGGRLLVTNINQKSAPEVKTKEGVIKIDSYYHRPEEIKKILQELAYTTEKEEIVYENDVWVNQIIVARK